MDKKQLILTTILSSILTIFLLSAVFYGGGFVIAQDDGNEPSDGFPYSNSNTESLLSDGQNDAAEPLALADLDLALNSAADMSHVFILGSHLLPRRSTLEYTYNSYGCLSVTGGSGNRMQFPVMLPDGSVIKSMDIIYNDTSTSNLTLWLSDYDPGVGNTDLIGLSSSGNSGIGTNSSAEITHVVDNSENAYSLIYSWAGVTDSSLQICGIRINYMDPFHATFMPSIIDE